MGTNKKYKTLTSIMAMLFLVLTMPFAFASEIGTTLPQQEIIIDSSHLIEIGKDDGFVEPQAVVSGFTKLIKVLKKTAKTLKKADADDIVNWSGKFISRNTAEKYATKARNAGNILDDLSDNLGGSYFETANTYVTNALIQAGLPRWLAVSIAFVLV